jgi:hypothetical protein
MPEMQFRDVALHTNASIFGQQHQLEEFPSVEQRIDLSEQIWIGRLDSGLAKSIMDTCEPKTLGIDPIIRQFSQLYTFVRELPQTSDPYHWDHDNQLSGTVALSRLVHPTSTGFAYAARIGYDTDGVKQIFPAQIIGISREGFLSSHRTRDWLTRAEAVQLREIVPALGETLPRRVHSALWYHEYAVRTYYLDYRWILVCTGLEALVHTDWKESKKQFSRRVTALASEIGISLSPSEASEAWELRSGLAHGASFLVAGTDSAQSASHIQLYDKLEDILRTAVLRGIRDQSFRSVLSDDDQIRRRWPI